MRTIIKLALLMPAVVLSDKTQGDWSASGKKTNKNRPTTTENNDWGKSEDDMANWSGYGDIFNNAGDYEGDDEFEQDWDMTDTQKRNKRNKQRGGDGMGDDMEGDDMGPEEGDDMGMGEQKKKKNGKKQRGGDGMGDDEMDGDDMMGPEEGDDMGMGEQKKQKGNKTKGGKGRRDKSEVTCSIYSSEDCETEDKACKLKTMKGEATCMTMAEFKEMKKNRKGASDTEKAQRQEKKNGKETRKEMKRAGRNEKKEQRTDKKSEREQKKSNRGDKDN